MDRGGLQASPWGHNRVGCNLATEQQKHDQTASNTALLWTQHNLFECTKHIFSIQTFLK